MENPDTNDPKTEDASYEVVGVRFDSLPGTYVFARNRLNVRVGELVVAETDRGEGVGIVVRDRLCPGCRVPTVPAKKLLRKASSQDIENDRQRGNLESMALRLCREKVRSCRLEMNLVAVHYHFDRSKAIFYFTAEARVDFRELVKNLAKELNTRIEMRQIGVRDKARLVGGVGGCGRELCCKSFLSDFEPVSVRMAKDQNLPLNPSKISGVCGRLMCCLTYEHKTYRQLCKDMPKCGKKVQTPDGAARVTRQNPLSGTVVVETEEGEQVTLSSGDLQPGEESGRGKKSESRSEPRHGKGAGYRRGLLPKGK